MMNRRRDGRQCAKTGPRPAARSRQKPRSHDTSRIAWAKLMARMGEEFLVACPACGGDIRLIAFITEPGPIRKVLTHLGEPLEPPPVFPARGPPIDWGEFVQAHDDRAIFQASPDDLAVIDIHSLEPASDTRRRSHGNVRLGRGLRQREKNAIAEGKPRVLGTLFAARKNGPTAHEPLVSSGVFAEVPLTGLSVYPAIDMHPLPSADGALDVVVHSETLEHVAHPVRALEECRRVWCPPPNLGKAARAGRDRRRSPSTRRPP